MSFQKRSKLLGLSFVTCLSLVTSGVAGVITTVPQASPSSSSGFDGWNLGNVDVLITDLDYIVNTALEYNTTDGSYTAMGVGDSFESQIKDDSGILMGKLHGKDWPVGEPSGVKVLNDIPGTTNGKPGNCIMTTSYLDGFYLGTASPQETDCASPFQSHKRFKINLQPSTVDGAGEESVDMVFNVGVDAETRRYQMFQKINNYTDSRLGGFSIEVGTGVGTSFVQAPLSMDLNLSIGEGENNATDIWSAVEVAAFSHGLWGPADNHFPTDGFFGPDRAGYSVNLGTDDKSIVSGLESPSTYTTLLGDWLPSIWQPSGIFFDDDNDPTTDAQLMAFWADQDGDTVYAWTGPSPDFDIIDPAVVNVWALNPLYSMGHIEDVLNLGLNYIINVGDVSTFDDYNVTTDAATFTIRITPTAAADQTEPGWMSSTPVFEVTNPGVHALPSIIMYILD